MRNVELDSFSVLKKLCVLCVENKVDVPLRRVLFYPFPQASHGVADVTLLRSFEVSRKRKQKGTAGTAVLHDKIREICENSWKNKKVIPWFSMRSRGIFRFGCEGRLLPSLGR